jgi:acyl dehydratase
MTTGRTSAPDLAGLAGLELGEHTVRYDERDTILYNLAVGARADELDLVYERNLRALPTMACAYGLWAVEAAGRTGAYDPHRSLHAAQELVVHEPLPPAGTLAMSGRVHAVWDKGKASVVEIEVGARAFTARYSIFLPGRGGWGGERGPSSSRTAPPEPTWTGTYPTAADLAVLYRLTGDRHPVHVDPAVAAANGFDRPILHGLCTLGIAARTVAAAVDRHPAQLRELRARLAAPVLPGDAIELRAAGGPDGVVTFAAAVRGTAVLADGLARYTAH